MVLNPAGEDILVLCEPCDYAANQQIANVRRPEPPRRGAAADGRGRDAGHRRRSPTSPRSSASRRVADGEGDLLRGRRRAARHGHRPRRRRGQRDQARATRSRAAGCGRRTSDEIRAAGMEPGYASPIGARRHVRRRRRPRRRARRTSSPARTAPASTCATSTSAATSRPTSSPTSRTPAKATPARSAARRSILRNGIEVGNIFKLGTNYTEALGATYLGEDGAGHPIVMGSYGIGVGRNLACIVEAHHDDKGIVWPASVAPYAAHLVSIGAPTATRRSPRSPSALHALALDGRPRDPLRRPRRVAGREVHRRRAARHAVDPDGQPALPGGRRASRSPTGRPGERSIRSIEEVEALLRVLVAGLVGLFRQLGRGRPRSGLRRSPVPHRATTTASPVSSSALDQVPRTTTVHRSAARRRPGRRRGRSRTTPRRCT